MSAVTELAFIGSIFLGLIPAMIARRKGRSFLAFWLFGSIALIPALPFALAMEANEKELAERAERAATARGEIPCPACREFIRGDATICPHCRTVVQPLVAGLPN
jgi:hypothetical protein